MIEVGKYFCCIQNKNKQLLVLKQANIFKCFVTVLLKDSRQVKWHKKCMRQTPAILFFQIKKSKFLEKNGKFLVPLSQYKGVSPYQGKNDTEKMVDTINKNYIRP